MCAYVYVYVCVCVCVCVCVRACAILCASVFVYKNSLLRNKRHHSDISDHNMVRYKFDMIIGG